LSSSAVANLESEPHELLLGATVAGKYRVDALIGRGGMGAVYRATHLGIGKRVALKFLDRDATRDRDAVARFQREAEAASAVDSAHIVQLFDHGEHEGQPYLVMELLQGEDLRALLAREGRLGFDEALPIVAQICRALTRAHAAGIVHRDLKPDNVFLCQRDDEARFVKLVDFGISKVREREATVDTLTRRGTVLGTAFYMSPEQAQSFADVDARADLWSVGAILFELLAGRPPFAGRTYEAVLIEACTKDPPPLAALAPEVPGAVAEVVRRCLRRDRDERFATARELEQALLAAAHAPVSAHSEPFELPPLPKRRRTWPYGVAAVVVLVAVGVALVRDRAPRATASGATSAPKGAGSAPSDVPRPPRVEAAFLPAPSAAPAPATSGRRPAAPLRPKLGPRPGGLELVTDPSG
jgi:eukaryotic-like serine/threonine-protein kinase